MKRILFAILSFFILPVVVFAGSAVSNVNFKIKQDYFNVHIEEDGDVKVQELIRYSGSLNGAYLNLAYGNVNTHYNEDDYSNNAIYNFDGYKDVKIYAKKLDKVSFDTFNHLDGFHEFHEVDYASPGDELVYTLNESLDEDSYKVFYPVHNDSVVFLYEYTLKKPVVIHDDVAELYWQIFDKDPVRDDQSDVSIRVYLPSSDTKDTFRMWTHDILSSNIYYIEDGNDLIGFEVHADEVEPEDLLDIRTIFNKDLITDQDGLDRFYGNGLEKIVEVEEDRAAQANAERERLRKIYDSCVNGSKILAIINAAAFIFLIFKYAVKPKTNFYAKYYREFIEDYPVEVVDYLYNKNVTSKALSAAIMNLVYNKVCHTEELIDEKGKSKKKEYKFILDIDKDENELSEADNKLVSFLFGTVGNGQEFTTKELKKYASSLSTGSKFQSNYTKWMNIVKKEGIKQNFFKGKSFGGILTAALTIVSIGFLMYGASHGVDSPFIFLPFVTSIVIIIFMAAVKAYNAKGALHIKKWDAFKNFLNDFGTFDVKELPEIALWERYLVYATVFGLAKKVLKSIEVKIKELGIDDTTFTTTYRNIYIYDSISHSFSTAVSEGRRQYAASRANAYSSSSSGGGFGGGGSFGGGFGGGGGGRGGF